jgi:hypothetical protein
MVWIRLKRYRNLYESLYIRLWEPSNFFYTGAFLFNITFGVQTVLQERNLTDGLRGKWHGFIWCRKISETFAVLDYPVGIRVYSKFAAIFGLYEDPSVTYKYEGPTILEQFNIITRNQANWLGKPFHHVLAWLDNTGIHAKWEQDNILKTTFQEMLAWKRTLSKSQNKIAMKLLKNEYVRPPVSTTIQMESIVNLFKLFSGMWIIVVTIGFCEIFHGLKIKTKICCCHYLQYTSISIYSPL